jgi:GTP-binding protein EngB required for normal cell division
MHCYTSRKAHTESSKKWLEMLEDKSVPVLVCLTYADKLYAECMGKDGSHPNPQDIKYKIAEEADVSAGLSELCLGSSMC